MSTKASGNVIVIDGSDDSTSSGDEGNNLATLSTNTPFILAEWPHHVARLKTNYNPDGIPLPYTHRFGRCGCGKLCRHHKCRNATLGVFCAPNCCSYGGSCGNSLSECADLQLVQEKTTSSFAVVATAPIKKGVIIGEYLGRITMVPPPRQRIQNRGYRFVLREAPAHSGQWRACIDAETHGSLMRFVNHSCRPTARFHEVGNGRYRTVVVATIQPIQKNQEVTVNYGDELWFVCRCGRSECIHRDIQDHQHA